MSVVSHSRRPEERLVQARCEVRAAPSGIDFAPFVRRAAL